MYLSSTMFGFPERYCLHAKHELLSFLLASLGLKQLEHCMCSTCYTKYYYSPYTCGTLQCLLLDCEERDGSSEQKRRGGEGGADEQKKVVFG